MSEAVATEPLDQSAPNQRDAAPAAVRSLVSPEELKRFREPRGAKLWFDFALIWGQVIAGIAIYLLFPTPLGFAVALVFVGSGQHGLGLAGHEFVHYSVVPSDRRKNDRIGNWLFASPIGLPLALYRHRHFEHHRTYGTAQDTKTVYRRDPRGWRLFLEMFLCLSGIEYAYRAFESIARDRRDESSGRDVPSPLQTLPPIAITQLVIFGLFSLIDPWLYLWLWILPIVTVMNALNKLRAWMEHRPLDAEAGVWPDGPYYRGTPGPFVRTVTSGWFERFLISKINFGYHVEHHVWPQISYQYLPTVRERLVENGVFEDGRFGFESGYLSTVYKLWRGSS